MPDQRALSVSAFLWAVRKQVAGDGRTRSIVRVELNLLIPDDDMVIPMVFAYCDIAAMDIP